MTLRLILMRHAKSSWQAPLESDRARPLSGRGCRAATAIGKWMAGQGHEPDAVLSSDAARTRETWALIDKELPGKAPVSWLAELYQAGPQEVLDAIRRAPRGGRVLMVIGHNPAMAGAVDMLLRATPSTPAFRAYPTAATMVMRFAAEDWRTVDWGRCDLIDFVVPRDLGVS